MSETKTVNCLPYFAGGQSKALYKFAWSQIYSSLDLKVHLNYECLPEIGICKTAFYEECKEGDLIIAVDTEETFGVNVESGELVIAFPENCDFEVDNNGCLSMFDRPVIREVFCDSNNGEVFDNSNRNITVIG